MTDGLFLSEIISFIITKNTRMFNIIQLFLIVFAFFHINFILRKFVFFSSFSGFKYALVLLFLFGLEIKRTITYILNVF